MNRQRPNLIFRPSSIYQQEKQSGLLIVTNCALCTRTATHQIRRAVLLQKYSEMVINTTGQKIKIANYGKGDVLYFCDKHKPEEALIIDSLGNKISKARKLYNGY